MKKLIFIFSLGVSLTGLRLLAATPEKAPSSKTSHRILFLKDSVESQHGEELERVLNQTSNHPFAVFQNLPSTGGDLIERALPPALDRLTPDMTIIMMGPNDSGERALKLIRAVRSHNVPVILIYPPGTKTEALMTKDADIVLVEDDGSLAGPTQEIRKRFSPAFTPSDRTATQRAAAYRLIADTHRDFGDPIGALNSLSSLLELLPDDTNALKRLIDIGLDAGAPWRALIYADRLSAVKTASPADQAASNLQAGDLRLELGDFAGAARNFLTVLTLRPDDSPVLRLLAEANRERPDEALSYAERAAQAQIGAASERAKANLLAGEIKIDLDDAAGAEKNFERAVALMPNDLDALFAVVKIKRDRKEEAGVFAKRLAQAASKEPHWRRGPAYRLSARAWLDIGEYSQALRSLTRALELAPEDLDALGALVRIKDKLTSKELAMIQLANLSLKADKERKPASKNKLTRALERDPDDLEALRMLIVRTLAQGKQAEAAAHAYQFQRVASKAPLWQRAAAFRVLTNLWFDLGNEDNAARSLEQSLRLQSDSVETALNLRRVLPNQSTVGVFSVDLIFIYCTAADLRIRLGDWAGAEVLLKQSLRLDPNHEWTLRLLSSFEKTKLK